jgi:hypothetical protein
VTIVESATEAGRAAAEVDSEVAAIGATAAIASQTSRGDCIRLGVVLIGLFFVLIVLVIAVPGVGHARASAAMAPRFE